MRKSITTVVGLVAALMGAACEDGPSQTYTPAPTGAANVWNGTPGGGGIPPGSTYVTPATQGFDAASGGQNANDLCTATQEKIVWTDNFRMAMIPNPGLGAGLDLAGGANGSGVAGYDPACLTYTSCNPPQSAPAFSYDSSTATETWTGITLQQAQGLLCQASVPTPIFGPSSVQGQAGWGENDEFNTLYNINNQIITDLLFSYGYIGTLVGVNSLMTPKVTYTISMNNVYMTKTVEGGSPENIVLNWSDGSLPGVTNEIYEALRQSYLPDFPPDKDCVAAGHCIIDNNLTEDGILFFTPFNLAIFVLTTVGTPFANSSPFLVDVALAKLLPFSDSTVTLKLDPQGEGPTAISTAAQLGTGATKECKYVLGETYANFQSDCVQPYPSGDARNAVSQAKLVGAIAHGDEAYEFNINGVDPQFTATLTPTTVIADGQLPSAADVAYQLEVDQYVLGPIANDYTNNDSTQPKDWHGIGLVTLEWANLVQQYMTANYGVNTQLGDPGCIANPINPAPGGDAGASDAGAADAGAADAGAVDGAAKDGGATKDAAPATDAAPAGGKVCSGLEGIVTTAPPALVPKSMAPNALGAAGVSVNNINALTGAAVAPCSAADVQSGASQCQLNQIAVGLKPGTWYSLFCQDAGGLDGSGVPQGYTNCFGGTGNFFNPYQGYFFDTMQAAVALSYGHVPGQAGGYPIPETLANRRFYFQEWILALVKYLQSADTPTATLATIDGNSADPNLIFFDSLGGGFEYGQYYDNTTVNSAKQAPTSISVATNLQTSVLNDFSFTRYNFRGETLLFNALKDNSADQPGYEPLYVQNMVGSPILQSVYQHQYACAIDTAGTNPNCGGIPAPTDALGNPLYLPYSDAFGVTIPPTMDGGATTYGTSVFNIATLGGPPQATGMTVDSADYELIQSAMVKVPVITPPYAFTGTVPTTAPLQELLPYLTGDGVGFPVTIDGSRDKFYNTQSITFTGNSINDTMDFEYVPVGSTNLVVRAIETQNYLGLVFACYEPSISPTAVPGQYDILGVRMYQNGDDILDWISSHTVGSANPISDCGIQLKYSIYGNYPDYISFGINPGLPMSGVRFGLNAGFGGAVVSEVTIFDPNIVASLGQ